MIGPGTDVRVMVATGQVDFRKGADSLAALVKAEYGANPFSGVVHVFHAKRAGRSSGSTGMPEARICRTASAM